MKTKAELIAAMAEKTGITNADTGRMMDAFVTVVQGEFKAGNKVRLDGLGIFTPVTRAATTRRNPQTGAPVDVPAKKTVTFKPALDLRREMNG